MHNHRPYTHTFEVWTRAHKVACDRHPSYHLRILSSRTKVQTESDTFSGGTMDESDETTSLIFYEGEAGRGNSKESFSSRWDSFPP
jgi:hypothetical protein